MKRWNLVVDVAKCHDCNNCFLSCKDEYVDNDFLPYSLAQPRHGHRWMNIMRKERGRYPKVDVAYLPVPCMHCDDAPCIKAARDGAVYKREDGIVLIDPVKARGQKGVVDACPYGAVWWNSEKAVPQKCTFCVHLLDEGWKEPRCVQACPTGALSIIRADDAEMARIRESEGLEPYLPELGTRPRVYYRNLYRYTKCFIAGSVALRDPDECAEGARVILMDGTRGEIGETTTNNYGDFKFDNLEEESGRYILLIQYPGHEEKKIEVELNTSLNIGTVFL
ncbi:MAG: oxidoreductase [Deltaproteobacteria bacterium]|nr:oxidoreductase [Deltaproteobacteria bacterium]MBW2015755.1 oxidoreductase [Deltaproteobacteria bacterium]MBW2128693.1 oxidoreductase [Deltaproteobacteria bacterium]MBW2302727.1 oxidoreductase [Deltaproteobacteria bacterium]